MDSWEIILAIAVLIIALAVFALVMFTIPTIIQLRHSLRRVEEVTEGLNQRLPQLLDNANQISGDVSQVTGNARKHVQNVSDSVDQVRNLIGDLSGVEKHFRARSSGDGGRMKNWLAIFRAAEAFFTVMTRKRR